MLGGGCCGFRRTLFWCEGSRKICFFQELSIEAAMHFLICIGPLNIDGWEWSQCRKPSVTIDEPRLLDVGHFWVVTCSFSSDRNASHSGSKFENAKLEVAIEPVWKLVLVSEFEVTFGNGNHWWDLCGLCQFPPLSSKRDWQHIQFDPSFANPHNL